MLIREWLHTCPECKAALGRFSPRATVGARFGLALAVIFVVTLIILLIWTLLFKEDEDEDE